MSERINALLSKPVEDLTEEELLTLRQDSYAELEYRVFENFKIVVEQYIELYGKKEGIEQIGEHLCRRIAPGRHPGGWGGLVQYLVKISG